MLNLLQEVAVAKVGSTETSFARLVNVMEGVDGSASFGYNVEEDAIAISDNQKVQRYHDHSLDVRLLNDPEAAAKIDAMDEGYIAGYTPDGFLSFNKGTVLGRNPQYDSNIVSAFSARTRTLAGYANGANGLEKPVYAGRNLLGLYDVTQPNNQALFSGFDTSGPNIVSSFDGDWLTLERSATGSSLVLSEALFWPFDKPIKATIEADTGSGADFQMGVAFYSQEVAGLVGEAEIDIPAASTGDFTLEVTPPSTTRFVRFFINPANDITSVCKVRKPRITRGANTKFSL